MTTVQMKYFNNENNVTQKGAMSHFGETSMSMGQDGYDLDPTQEEGFESPGRPTVVNETPNINNMDISSGSPKLHVVSLITESSMEIDVTLDHFNLLGIELSMAHDLATEFNYVQDSPDVTVVSSTQTSAVLSAVPATMKQDSLIQFDHTDGTYGGFKPVTIITSIRGNTIHFAKLSTAPKPNSTVKTLNGLSGAQITDKSKAGAILPIIPGGVKHPTYQMRIKRTMTNNRGILISHYPQVQITKGTPFDFGNADKVATVSFTAKPIAQEGTFNVREGQGSGTRTMGYYGKLYWCPN